VPADVPFSFQTLDRNGMVLNMAQTWHMVRPGESRTNCGGCHAHNKLPIDFAGTAAAQSSYPIADLTHLTSLLTKDSAGNTTVSWRPGWWWMSNTTKTSSRFCSAPACPATANRAEQAAAWFWTTRRW